MGHAVHHRDAAGEIHLEEVASLEAALDLVARLRDDGNSDVRLYREVPVEVRTYHRAVVMEEQPSTATVPLSETDVAPEGAAAPVTEPHETVATSWTGRSGPPPGAMPLVPPVTVRDDLDDEVAAEPPEPEHRRPLFSRG
jgi:hypothetical protein